MDWHSLVAGSTRINPLTNEPMFSHSIFAHDNAIHKEFAPFIAQEGPSAVESLRCILKSNEPDPNC